MRWLRFFFRKKWDQEQAEEIESHLQFQAAENIGRGLDAEEARAAAQRELGNSTIIREEIYIMNMLALVDPISLDIRYALRTLRKNPMFTFAALVTIAIGIGANTAVFSVVNSVLLKPLSYPKAEQLVSLHQLAPGAAGSANLSDGLRLSPSMYFTYAEQNRTFQSVGVWASLTSTVTGLAEPEQVRSIVISDGVLQALNVTPLVGRWLSAEDQIPRSRSSTGAGLSTAVMLGYGYWQQRFGGDQSVIGRTITVDSRLREIVGIMPQGFRVLNAEADVISPWAFDRQTLTLSGFNFQAIARLRPGTTIDQANADISRMLPIWMNSWPSGSGANAQVYETWRITPDLRPLKQEVIGGVRDVLWVVMATIGLVMLIACANVANLLLVRAEIRQKELSLRAALGAGRGQIVRSLLIESMLLGLMGGGLGVCVADAGLRLLVAIGPANLPRLNEVSLDGRALGFTVILSLLSGVLFGLVPALKYTGPKVTSALASIGRTASLSRERHRVRSVLVVGQVVISLVLLVGAGLMIRTFQAIRTVEPGFIHPETLQIMRIYIPASLVPDPGRVMRMQNEIQNNLSSIPGVTSAAFGNAMPLEQFPLTWDAIRAADPPDLEQDAPLRLFKFASPGFFQTAGTRLVAGREISWTELYGLRPVVMVSENLARELWGPPNAALGKRVRRSPDMPWHEVVGVVENVRESDVHLQPPPTVYWPPISIYLYATAGRPNVIRAMTYVIRTQRIGTEGFLNQVRNAVWSVNSSLPASPRTMLEVYDRSLAGTSFTLVMLAIAGAMALVLGVIGIYGVVAYAISQRRREIGIRLALGAKHGDLKLMFVHHALALAAIGVGIGSAAAMALTRMMKSLLFGVTALDPLTYAAVAGLLVLAATVASYVPARRVAALDPVEALRAE